MTQHTLSPMSFMRACCMGVFSLGALTVGADRGELINAIDMLGSDYGDSTAPIPSDSLTKALTNLHNVANDKAGIQFSIEQAFLYTHGRNTAPAAETNGNNQSWYKLHVLAGVQVFKSESNQGTWIKGELSGSTALNCHTHRTNLDTSWGASGPADCDVFESDYFYIPELLLMQGFMQGQFVLMAGMINQTNYLDTNSYANNTFGQFGSAPFVNNQVLPLVDSNLGVLAQYQINDNWLVQAGFNMMSNEPGRNCFHHSTGKAFNVIGELAWTHENALGIGAGTYRLQPFMFHDVGKNHGGVALNFEQDLGNSPLAIFGRAGWSSAESCNIGGASTQVSAGVVLKKPLQTLTGIPESDTNFLGVALSVSKPDHDAIAAGNPVHKREIQLECSYTVAVTPYFMVQPAYRHIKNPADRADASFADIFSLQCICVF